MKRKTPNREEHLKNSNKQLITKFIIRSCIILVIIGLMSIHNICGQAELQYHKISNQYLTSYFQKSVDILESPTDWETNEWAVFTGTTGAACVAYAYDLDIRSFFQQHKSTTTKNLTQYFFEPMGNPIYWAGVLGATYLIGEMSNDAKARSFALTSGKALVLNGLFTLAGKHLSHRSRPFQGEKPNPYNWSGPLKNRRFDAFPSGHTSTAFTMAAVFSEYYKNIKWLEPVAYALATCAGISRIHDDKHWASDVIVGAALGYGIGKLVISKDFVQEEHAVKGNSIPPVMIGFTLPLGGRQ